MATMQANHPNTIASPDVSTAMSYETAVAHVEGLGSSIQKLGLSRMTHLLETLGNPQNAVPTVHVAGSNGKGSVSAMLTGVLKAAGYRVGTYTSPHLVHLRERIALNGNPILPDDFAQETNALKAHLDTLALTASDSPTYFEFLNLLAHLYFREKNVDIAVIETGLGGRLDSTNAIRHPNVTVITGISLEHAHILGNTLGRIAAEKAGIFKPGAPVVLGPNLPEEALCVIREKAAALNLPVTIAPAETLDVLPGSSLAQGLMIRDTAHGNTTYTLSLRGIYQRENLATALATIRQLQQQGFEITQKAVQTGFAQTHWPARFQYFPRERLIIDGSHNAQGFAALKTCLETYLPDTPLYWALSLQANRDPATLIALASQYPTTHGIVWTQASGAHVYHNPGQMAEQLRQANPGFPVTHQSQSREALAQLKQWLTQTPKAIGIITGSLYTAGEILATGLQQ